MVLVETKRIAVEPDSPFLENESRRSMTSTLTLKPYVNVGNRVDTLCHNEHQRVGSLPLLPLQT